MENVLAEWLSKHGLRQYHVAETEKYAHVTFFFNGGREAPFPLEERYTPTLPFICIHISIDIAW
jgi:2,3-bisphosphoglycerate-independent phosphoglycerate mutase